MKNRSGPPHQDLVRAVIWKDRLVAMAVAMVIAIIDTLIKG